MNKSVFTRIRERLQPSLDASAPTGLLDAAERHRVLALFRALVADETFPAERLWRHVDERTCRHPGVLAEYRSGLALLDATSSRLLAGRRFADVPLEQRDRVLRRILRRFPHPDAEPAWLRWLRLTRSNLDMVLSRRRTRAFREHVVRDLLALYYTSAAGWAVVGYHEYPGKVNVEDEPTEVTSVRVEDDTMVLELSDGTYDVLVPEVLELEGETRLAVRTKSGRQRAVFSHHAHHALLDCLADVDGRLVLTVGSRRHDLPRALLGLPA